VSSRGGPDRLGHGGATAHTTPVNQRVGRGRRAVGTALRSLRRVGRRWWERRAWLGDGLAVFLYLRLNRLRAGAGARRLVCLVGCAGGLDSVNFKGPGWACSRCAHDHSLLPLSSLIRRSTAWQRLPFSSSFQADTHSLFHIHIPVPRTHAR
jgi:hypothetical protein